jgi:hypothetical protein
LTICGTNQEKSTRPRRLELRARDLGYLGAGPLHQRLVLAGAADQEPALWAVGKRGQRDAREV